VDVCLPTGVCAGRAQTACVVTTTTTKPAGNDKGNAGAAIGAAAGGVVVLIIIIIAAVLFADRTVSTEVQSNGNVVRPQPRTGTGATENLIVTPDGRTLRRVGNPDAGAQADAANNYITVVSGTAPPSDRPPFQGYPESESEPEPTPGDDVSRAGYSDL
jgi:hypothetical protein